MWRDLRTPTDFTPLMSLYTKTFVLQYVVVSMKQVCIDVFPNNPKAYKYVWNFEGGREKAYKFVWIFEGGRAVALHIQSLSNEKWRGMDGRWG